MKLLPYPLLALLSLLTLPVQAQATASTMNGVAAPVTAFNYFDPATIDLKVLLPDPPADGSPATLKEIDLILEKQQSRTP